jgi:pyruvate, orthophosphate dikinase
MAQTKSKSTPKSKPRRSSASKSAKPASKSKPKAKAKPKAAKAKAKSSSKPRSSSNGAARSNGSGSKHSNVEAVRSAVGDAGKTVGKVAGKAKVPLVAGGAALAGAAGGMALAASKKGRKGGIGKAMAHRPKIKVDSKDIAKAAKGVGQFSSQVSEVAGGLETAASGKNGKHRSPIEVVLQGLTARR